MSFNLIPQAYAATSWLGSECVGKDVPEGETVATINGITCLISNLLKPIPALIALAAVSMIIMSGIRLMTAGSDPKAVASAWSTLTWAVIGLILMAGVWLVLVIIENITGAKVTQFGIPN